MKRNTQIKLSRALFNKFALILYISMMVFPAMAAEKIKGQVFDENNQPVIGASIIWEKTTFGTTTDTSGYFEIEASKDHKHLLVTFMGYVPQQVHIENPNEKVTVYLKEDTELLDEVVVSERAPGTITQRDALLQTQKITMGEIRRDACCNLGESFVTNPSVDVAYSDAATGAKQIKLLGLAGTYVQMLTENYPNFRGAATNFGMDYIPGPWMEGIYISKGTSSVKNGYEALAGQINVEYKKPQTMDKLSVNLFANDALRTEINADAGIHINDKLQTGVFAHYSNDKQAHDRNVDGFLDYPVTERFNFMNRWGHSVGNYTAQYGVKYINENRTGGQDTKHHAFDDPYRISLNTNRGEFYTKQAYSTITEDNLLTSTAIIASASIHDQKSMYDRTKYDVNQKNLYLSFLFEKEFSRMHQLSTGLSLNYDGFDEMLRETPIDRKETVAGGYLQYTYNLNDKLIAMGGIRADYSSLYGFFVTPRMHLKYNPTEWVHFRTSIGKGFRTANVLAENNYLLASSRKINIADNLEQEEAWNTGANVTFYIPIAGKQMTLSGEFYYTRFINQVVVDVDSDPHAINFYNLDGGKSYSSSSQIEMSYPFFKGFTFTAAYRYTRSMSDFRNPETGEVRYLSKPLMNDYKGLVTASYQAPLRKWQFDVTAQFNGGGRMSTPASVNPLWEDRYQTYTVVNSQITKYFRNWSLFLGAENLLDFRQLNPIVDAANPRSNDFDATMVWGPVDGRKIFAGLRINIPRY